MAVSLLTKSLRLQLKYAGDIINGKQTFISKTYSRVKPAAADQDLYDVAQVLANLQSKPLHSIHKLVDSEMNQE